MRWRTTSFIFLSILSQLTSAIFLKGSCSENPDFCGPNGRCHAGPFENGMATHWCRCDDGYGGQTCDKSCDLKCSKGFKCIFDIVDRPSCVCQDCDMFGHKFINCSIGFGGNNYVKQWCFSHTCTHPPDVVQCPSCEKTGYCYPNQCQNGGKCYGENDVAKCHCPTGFQGEYCEIDVDECAENHNEVVCYNGKCENLFGGYKCNCDAGFIGPDCLFTGTPEEAQNIVSPPPPCLIQIDPITSEKIEAHCRNSGVCQKIEKNLSKCECPRGFQGELCEIDVNECEMNVCENGGTCTNFNGGFQCSCRAGFIGERCEINEDDCEKHECSEGSKCIDGIARYSCECEQGKMGTYCDMVDHCISSPGICNHGDCVPLPETGGFDCNCDRGFQGELCNVDINECENDKIVCRNDGKCLNLIGSWKCECAHGYNGTYCEEPIETCEVENVKCLNNGSCHVGPNREPICLCQQGFFGDRCEIPCPPNRGGINCELFLNKPICGENLPKCANGGICNAGFCSCSANFTGNYCEISRKPKINEEVAERTCESNPCLNNATCIDSKDSIGYKCICPDGYDGYVCESKRDFCSPNPCFNGGQCFKNPEKCKCPNGFNGKYCENIQQCSIGTCENGGICRGSRCECTFGFMGTRCEQKVKELDEEKLFKEVCETRNCSSRANDGNCDLDCNFSACGLDGGDCDERRKPFSKCRYGNTCARLFANGVCNQACNNEECLFDGMDCMPQVPRCPLANREYCASKFADGECDLECNTDGCGFDGGDCETKRNQTLSNIRLKILMPPKQFQENGGRILMDIGVALRSIIRIQTDSDGPLVFEWNGEEEEDVGKRVKMNVKQLEEQQVVSSRRVRREVENKGVIVWLEVEMKSFSTSQSVVDYLSAEISKKSENLPIYEAIVAKPRKNLSNSNQIIFFACVGFVLVGGAIAGIAANGNDNRNRKRRIISAPVWMPPTEQQNEKNRKNSILSTSQNSLLGSQCSSYYDVKRARMDSAYGMMNEHYPMYPQFSADFGGYGDNNLTTVQPCQETLSILYEAAGSGHITTPINSENVNIPDQKHKRTVLHWLAANSAGKQEELIAEEAEKCIKAGAEVNAMDVDENTALVLAVKAKRLRLAIILMRAGANPTIYNKSERSALHEAAVNLDLRMIQILLTDKRMVEEIDELDRNGRTALMEVARLDQNIQIAEYMIKKGAKIDADGANRKDSEVYKGRTALHYAAQYDNFRMLEYLVMNNANKDKQDEAGQTPLMLAAKEGHMDSVMFLIQQGASLDTTDLLDRTVRSLADAQQHYEIVEVLDKALSDREFNDANMRHQMHLLNGNNKTAKGGTKPHVVKAAKKSSKSSSSRDSTLHTPPLSDGSLSSPSPQHFINNSRTSCYQTSPASQYHLPASSEFYSNESPSSGKSSAMGIASTGLPSDSSPEYQPQDSEMINRNMKNDWFDSNVSYQKIQPTIDRNTQSAYYY